MALTRVDKHILLAVQRNIFVFDTENETNTLTVVPTLIRKVKQINGNEEKGEENDESKNEGTGTIVLLTASSCGHLVAVTTSGDKFLFIYEFEQGALKLLSTYQLARASSAIRFSADSKQVLVADKSGDCYIYECKSNEIESDGKWILGHCSMVLDILMSKCSRFVITSDRDEKIRVTNFPQTEEIETYCLGHQEFVSAIEEVSLESNGTYLVSISGDKMLRLWDYLNGSEVCVEELSAPGLKLIQNNKNQLAVSMLNERPVIAIYGISSLGDDKKITKLAEHTLDESVKHVNSMTFRTDDSIWLSCRNNDDELVFKELQLNENGILESDLGGLLKFATSIKLHPLEDVTILFKKRFDNSKDYQEKKKRRLDRKFN